MRWKFEVRDGVGFGFLACGVGIAAVEDFQHLNGVSRIWLTASAGEANAMLMLNTPMLNALMKEVFFMGVS